MKLPECDPVHKATIIPRGRALGLVMSLPEGDRYSKHKSKLLAELAMAMGGRVAEELIFGPTRSRTAPPATSRWRPTRPA